MNPMMKAGAVILAALMFASLVPLCSEMSDATGESEANPQVWWNSTVILLPEVLAGTVTDPEHQVLEPPQQLAVDWGDGRYEVRDVDGYVEKNSVEMIHTYSATGLYHIVLTPQIPDSSVRFDTYELWVEIMGSPTVYFYDGETEITHIVATNGEGVGDYENNYFTSVSAPVSEPTKEGKIFTGWYLNGEIYDFNEIVTSPIILQAHWAEEGTLFNHRVTYHDGNTVIGTQNVLNSTDGQVYTTITQSNPVKDGYSFKGWSLEPDGTAQYLIGATIVVDTEGLELYAVWEKNASAPVSVSVYVDGKAVSYDIGTKVGDIAKPVKEGLSFAGWYSDEYLTRELSSATVLTDGMHLYSRFTAVENIVEKVTVTTETRVSELKAPEKEGYEVEGWYSDEACTQKLTDEDLLAGMNAYAKYKAVSNDNNSVPVVAIAITVIGAIVAVVGLRYHPYILIAGIVIAAIGGLDLGGIITVF